MNSTTVASGAGFDPRPYLKKLNGKDYLEVVHRLQWLRAEHSDAVITTRLEQLDWQQGYAVFHARAEIPGSGIAEGTGSETREAFPSGWLEKAETIAVGRALAMLGYGTAFCLDFETADEAGNGHLADAPVERPASPTPSNGTGCGAQGPAPRSNVNGSGNLASPAQLRLLYLVAARDLRISEESLEERCAERYGRHPADLTKREASELIDALKAAAQGAASP